MGLCLPRHIPFNSTSIRYKSSKIKHHTVDPPGHGEKIYVFTHLQTKQVVYSLSRVLNNSAALAQIPYNGKKTVPRALRKDLWMPLAKICFSPGAGRTGLSAFQKLREYKRLHELQWGDEIALTEDGIPEKRNVRGRKIQNQKANSIADIAAVLSKIGTTEGAQIGLKGGFRNIEDQKAWIEEQAENTAQHMKTHHDATEEQMVELKAKRRRELEKKFEAENGEEVLTMVEVQWKDLNDAEFAEKWSENVVHDTL
ncbi:transcriptional regulation of mitochondrial recombination-domain-containing protein, partial [Calycina marina]